MPSSSIAAAVRVAEAAEAAEAAAEVRVAQAAEAAAEVRVAQAALLCWRNSPFRTPRSAKVTRPNGLWDALLPKDALPRAQQPARTTVTTRQRRAPNYFGSSHWVKSWTAARNRRFPRRALMSFLMASLMPGGAEC